MITDLTEERRDEIVEFQTKSFHTTISMSIDFVLNVEHWPLGRDRLPGPFHEHSFPRRSR